jgi:hypothetical protein
VSQPKKHHYIPVFYLKEWVGSQGRLCEYSRPHRKVAFKWRDPHATGYKEGLYTVPGLPSDEAEYIEKTFMGMTDDGAAITHKILLGWNDNGVQKLTPDQRISWARFLYALALRTPEDIERQGKLFVEMLPEFIEEYRIGYASLRNSTNPTSFDEFKANYLANARNISPLTAFPGMLNSELVLTAIASMTFRTIRLKQLAPLHFLTSDRPYIMTNGLKSQTDHIVLPISPKVLFIAEKGNAVYRDMMSFSARKLAVTVNAKLVEQAYKYVYAIDAQQLDFVERRLGKRVPASPFG